MIYFGSVSVQSQREACYPNEGSGYDATTMCRELGECRAILVYATPVHVIVNRPPCQDVYVPFPLPYRTVSAPTVCAELIHCIA